MNDSGTAVRRFGTAPVYFTAISTILGAILFLRFGYAVGTLGFYGAVLIILIGHLVTIPTALAISEIATNQKVEGGGEYFIISRSFGLNIGATIGIALYLSQAISVAFYVIAFTEAFEPFFIWTNDSLGIYLPRQIISLPAMAVLSFLIIRRGANLGVKTLYLIVGILFLSLALFFLGETEFSQTTVFNLSTAQFRNTDQFFTVFAICFPAFTGMTAGVGLSGDLQKPGRSIPLGTTMATVSGMIIYLFVCWKLVCSASPEDLVNHQLIMSKIAIGGALIIPLGLAASTISSAVGSVMVAPRTLQALGTDRSFPFKTINRFTSSGKGETNEPVNASIITCSIAFIFVALGNVDSVAQIISMFFMVTYGSLCLISFLYHFGGDPSYRPSFESKWQLSLLGFLMCVWLMFKMNAFYAVVSIIIMIMIYSLISHHHKDRNGLEVIFKSAIFQLSRQMHIYLQKSKKLKDKEKWRPSAICISDSTFKRVKPFQLMNWIAHKYGFGTYLHYIRGYYSREARKEEKKILNTLIHKFSDKESHVYIDTIISPSYTSAIAQIIQIPGISGMENNMVIFEFDKDHPENLNKIIENYALVNAGDFDVCIYGCTKKNIDFENGIHIWLSSIDYKNMHLMILLSFIIFSHPSWRKGRIQIFVECKKEHLEETKERFIELIHTGRLPISLKDVDFITENENVSIKSLIRERSKEAGLVLIGFHEKQIKHDGEDLLKGYEDLGDILFVNACEQKQIE